MTVRDRIENGFLEVVTKLDHFFVMAGRTEPASSATESKEIFVMAVRAFNAGEALV